MSCTRKLATPPTFVSFFQEQPFGRAVLLPIDRYFGKFKSLGSDLTAVKTL
jgi:hypothetical protein